MDVLDRHDVLMKFIVIGNCGTGKSCILHRFIEDKFTGTDEGTPTIGVEFGAKTEEILGKRVKLQIWDTAGQERYRSVTRSYYKGAAGCLVVYDITNRDSFDVVEQWLHDVKNQAGADVVIMLVGNKSDLGNSDRRQVTNAEAAALAQKHGLMHFETSAVTGDYVNEAFLKVARTILMQQHKKEEEEDDDDDDRAAPLVGLSRGGSGGKKSACAC